MLSILLQVCYNFAFNYNLRRYIMVVYFYQGLFAKK